WLTCMASRCTLAITIRGCKSLCGSRTPKTAGDTPARVLEKFPESRFEAKSLSHVSAEAPRRQIGICIESVRLRAVHGLIFSATIDVIKVRVSVYPGAAFGWGKHQKMTSSKAVRPCIGPVAFRRQTRSRLQEASSRLPLSVFKA